MINLKKFSFKCSCADVISVDANTREEAVEKFKAMLTAEEVAKHYAEKHVGQPVPDAAAEAAMLDQNVYEEVAAPAAA